MIDDDPLLHNLGECVGFILKRPDQFGFRTSDGLRLARRLRLYAKIFERHPEGIGRAGIKADGNWVMVTIANIKGESFSTLRKVVRVATIKRHGGSSIRRPVILVNLCLGNIQKTTEMTLTDRTEFSTPVLIGRSFLAGVVLVDSSRKYTTRPNCK